MNNARAWRYMSPTRKIRLMRLAVSSDGETCAQPAERGVELQDIYDKLYAYEQAEAESLILVLPVPEGTTVYQLRKTCEPLKCKSLLKHEPLLGYCPNWDRKNGCCMESSSNSPLPPENTAVVVDEQCFNRCYLQPIKFDVSMRNNFSNDCSDRLFISEEDARQVLANSITFLKNSSQMKMDYGISQRDIDKLMREQILRKYDPKVTLLK